MSIDYPLQSQLNDLRQLWQEAFGDDDAFLDHFYTYGFAPDRCRCLTEDGHVIAALYWFDCSYCGRPLAYLYGIATAKAFRGKGFCRALVENTHAHLQQLGYCGSILVPADETLFQMYADMGYHNCSSVSEFTCMADPDPIAMEQVDITQYCLLRRKFLPQNGVLQEGDCLDFLQTLADFYAGEDFLVAVSRSDPFFVPELLGNAQVAPKILSALRKPQGEFRTPGQDKAFAMYHPLSDMPMPDYFGLAFD